MIVKLNTIFHLLLPLYSFKSQFSNFTGQYAFTLQLNGDFPEHDCYVSENDTTNGMCATIYDDAGVECEGKILLLFLENFIIEFF
jgi:hypothetical protein